MIDLGKLGLGHLSVTAHPQPCRSLETEAGIEFQVAGRSYDPVIVDGRRPEAGDELSEAARGKSQRCSHRGVHFAKARVVDRPVPRRYGFDRLFSKDVTGGVDAIDADVLERPTPGSLLAADDFPETSGS